jgi:hypothetical protein
MKRDSEALASARLTRRTHCRHDDDGMVATTTTTSVLKLSLLFKAPKSL